jgi:hypothetical protein
MHGETVKYVYSIEQKGSGDQINTINFTFYNLK